jgi:hypothetical protein
MTSRYRFIKNCCRVAKQLNESLNAGYLRKTTFLFWYSIADIDHADSPFRRMLSPLLRLFEE